MRIMREPSESFHFKSPDQKDEEYRCMLSSSLAEAETRVVKCLRVAVFLVLVLTAALVCTGVYLYTRNREEDNFTTNFENDARQVMESFHDLIERNIGAIASLSSSITSHALTTNTSFPFVTLPHFETMGSHSRDLSGSHIIHWLPLVTDEKRGEWEQFAMENRDQIDTAFQNDYQFREEQDAEFESNNRETDKNTRHLQELEPSPTLTILDNETNYHPYIWKNGAVGSAAGDELPGEGPYLPGWQRRYEKGMYVNCIASGGYLIDYVDFSFFRSSILFVKSPIDEGKQRMLNMNWAKSRVIRPDLIQIMLAENKAVLNRAAVPAPQFKKLLENNLKISQYRERVDELVDGLSTFLTYPVFDSFDHDTRQVRGVLATNIYWQILLSNLLPSGTRGIICVIENSFNQTFSYRIDGADAKFIGMSDEHDTKYDDLEYAADIIHYLGTRAGPENRAYPTVALSDKTGYRIRVFPSKETEDEYVTNKPIIYTMVIASFFLFCALLFILFSLVVEKRQDIMMRRVIENATRATEAERELNEFLSHEVRNPLSAAISASSFVATAISEPEFLKDPEMMNNAREDMATVNSSLHLINDLLRSILDIYRANTTKMKITMAPTDIRRDIFDSVLSILYTRTANFKVLVECPDNLIVMTDGIRLKQVIINLVCNAAKYVEKGFVRMRADIVDNNVRLYVEDSGPGIAPNKRDNLFGKYQASLDLLSQGTGIGLNLSKKLLTILEGEIWLDESYNAGIDGCPGACFVIQLNSAPFDIETALPSESQESDPGELLHHGKSLFEDLSVELRPPSLAMASAEASQVQSAQSKKDPCRQNGLPLFSLPETPPSPLFSQSLNLQATDQPALSPPESKAAICNSAVPLPPPAQLPTSAEPAVAPTGTASRPPPPPPANQVTTSSDPPPFELPADMSVLFVDDDAVLRKLFVRAVKKAVPNWKVSEAASGETALRMCESGGTFDLIFLDQYMASVEKRLLGTETALAMRTKGIKSKLVGLSANDLRDAFIGAGADDFILKPMPCKPSALRQVLRDLLCPGEDYSVPLKAAD
jgi:signal transduction histidine kinase/CheY-like chemotaxis protein